ncbi:MAG: hypothetical protein ACKVY0_27035 [Prosthecobacter sp.]|uniref:hypothetical protein n=1 Tax=Prosthecobacter sp. TaxID=1965333 RepID=UPI0038FF2210
MNPEKFAAQMRQARLKSPLKTRAEALRQFAEVEVYLQRHALLPKSKLSGFRQKVAEGFAPSKI